MYSTSTDCFWSLCRKLFMSQIQPNPSVYEPHHAFQSSAGLAWASQLSVHGLFCLESFLLDHSVVPAIECRLDRFSIPPLPFGNHQRNLSWCPAFCTVFHKLNRAASWGASSVFPLEESSVGLQRSYCMGSLLTMLSQTPLCSPLICASQRMFLGSLGHFEVHLTKEDRECQFSL